MTEKEVATYYNSLDKGEKGRFVAYICLKVGGSPHTWQQKIIRWYRGEMKRKESPISLSFISQTIDSGAWR